MMGKVAADISVSLDGFITGPNDNVEQPLGEGGERLHEWIRRRAGLGRQLAVPGGPPARRAADSRGAGAGEGRRLFDGLAEHIELERTRVIDSPGVTHLKFRVVS